MYPSIDKMQPILSRVFALDDRYTISNLKKLYANDNLLSENKKDYTTIQNFVSALDAKNICSANPFVNNTEINPLDIYNPKDLKSNSIENQSPENNKDADYCINIEKETEDSSSDIIKQLEKYMPTAEKTPFYCIFFYKTLLYLIINTIDHDRAIFQNYFINTITLSSSSPLSAFHQFIVSMINMGIEERKYFVFDKIDKAFRHLIKDAKYTSFELEYVRLFAQIILCIITLDTLQEDDDTETIIDKQIPEVFTYINLNIARAFWGMHAPSDGLDFAKKSLNITDYLGRYIAFITLSRLAIQSGGQLQLAYDACYSWLYRKPVGEIKHFYTINPFFDEEEKNWREQNGKLREANMHLNMAYISSLIGDTYELETKRRQVFFNLAEDEIKKAIVLDPSESMYHSIYGWILTSQSLNKQNYELALKQYKLYLKKARHDERHLVKYFYDYYDTIINLLIIDYVNVIKKEKKNQKCSFDIWKSSDIINTYYPILKKANSHFNKLSKGFSIESLSTQYSYKKMQLLFSLLNFEKICSNKTVTSNVMLILILIRSLTTIIQNQLRRLEYTDTDYYTRKPNLDRAVTGKRPNVKTIAYYTTLKNATFLFDELIQKKPNLAPEKKPDHTSEKDSTIKSKNCLTVVHAQYMNDPYEGLTLLDSLVHDLQDNGLFPKDYSIQFRNNILKESFIFLKSFTEKVDKLFMWNRYASDYDVDGKNSNGCCVQFDPETFNRIISYPSVNDNKKDNNDNDDTDDTSIKIDDDYYLYRMVYLSSNNTITKEMNPGISEETINLFNALKRLIFELNEQFKTLSQVPEIDEIKSIVRVSLRHSLKILMFLFKSDDYAEEVESRLIFERHYDQQETIRLVSQNPCKLAINPYKQIYINKIIFGPNVRNTDEWTPYLQYELNKLWTKYIEETGDDSSPVCERYSIEKSTVHYHT